MEDAYQAYIASEQAENKATLEKQAAEGVDSVFSMSMESVAE